MQRLATADWPGCFSAQAGVSLRPPPPVPHTSCAGAGTPPSGADNNLRAYLDLSGLGLLYCAPQGVVDPCFPAGVLHVCPSPHGLRPVAVVPLLRSPRLPPPLHRLACTASRAWCAPGQPGWGILELNGGWRFETLPQLQAAVAASVAAAERSTGRTPPTLLQPLLQLAPSQPRKRCRPAVASPAESASSCCSLAAHPQCCCAHNPSVACERSPAAAAGAAAASAASRCCSGTAGADDGGAGDDEVCSAPKRRCTGGRQPQPSPAAAFGSGSPPPSLRSLRAAAAAADLPQFSDEELQILQECLCTPAGSGARAHVACDAAVSGSAGTAACAAWLAPGRSPLGALPSPPCWQRPVSPFLL